MWYNNSEFNFYCAEKQFSGGNILKKTKIASFVTALLLSVSLASCGSGSNEYDSQSGSGSHKEKARYTAYASLPEDTYYIPLYAKASDESDGIAPVFVNDELGVIEENGDWIKVDCRGYVGFIKKENVSDKQVEVKKRKKKPVVTTTTAVTTTEAGKTTTTKASGDKKDDKSKDKKEDKSEHAEISDQPVQEEQSAETQETTEAPSEAPTEAPTTKHLSADYYPDVTYSLDIVPHDTTSGKYDIFLTLDGRYSNYKYSLHRIFADGTDKELAKGESGDTRILLATVNSLTATQTIDRLIITSYLNGIAGNEITLDLNEPKL